MNVKVTSQIMQINFLSIKGLLLQTDNSKQLTKLSGTFTTTESLKENKSLAGQMKLGA
jgi:hypothetical protein